MLPKILSEAVAKRKRAEWCATSGLHGGPDLRKQIAAMRHLALVPRALAAALLCAGCAHEGGLQVHLANAEASAKKVDEQIKEADARLKAGELDRADGALAEGKKQLADPEMVYYPDRDFLHDRMLSAERRLAQAREQKALRELADQVAAQKERVGKASAQLKGDLDALQHREELTARKVAKAQESANWVNTELEDGKGIEARDAAYAAFAQAARKQLGAAGAQIAVCDKLVAFVAGPLAGAEEARGLFEQAQGEEKANKKAEMLGVARTRFQDCAKVGSAMLAATPALEKEAVLMAGAKSTARAAVTACETGVKAVDAALSGKKGPKKPAGKRK